MKFDRRRFIASVGAGAAVTLVSRISQATGPTTNLAQIAVDPDRPEYHFLAPHNWMNDPNGPIWWKGKYHLFYQLNPHAAVWGDMHWGHAESADLVHWKHLPVALTPTPGGADSEGCFSGSAVVYEGVPTILYTGVQNAPPEQATIRDANPRLRETQMLATAEDSELLHWKKLEQPVIAAPPAGMRVTGFRDPCPWREGDEWYLGVGSGESGVGGCVLLYRSRDLRTWEYLHKLAEGKPNGRTSANPVDSGEMWECPDFFALDGKHCLFYSAEGKVIWTTGEYDTKEHRYTATRTGLLDHGAYYAPKSFLAPDGRRILWGWITEQRPQAEFSSAGWAGSMSLPRALRTGFEGQLEIHPAREVEQLRGVAERINVNTGATWKRNLDSLRHELLLHVPLLRHSVVTTRLVMKGGAKWELTIDVPNNTVRCGEKEFELPGMPWPRPELRMFLDGSVIETFIGGREAVTSRVYGLKPGETEIEVAVSGDRAVRIEHWELAAISADRLTT